VSQQQQSVGAAINATGRLWGPPWSSRPIADSALERAIAAGREFIVDSSIAGTEDSALERTICRLTGAQAGLVTHSYSGAIWLAISTLAAGRELLVVRDEFGNAAEADLLRSLAASATAALREVSGAAGSIVEECEAATSLRTSAILQLCFDVNAGTNTSAGDLNAFIGLARDREVIFIAAMGAAPLFELPTTIHWPQPTVRDVIGAGADLVVVCGDGLIGGPPCGILVGTRTILNRIGLHPLCQSLRPDAMRSAALLATLECCGDSERATNALPMWQLLTTPVENLRNRAERIAPQLAQAPGINSASAMEVRSPISAATSVNGGWPSYGIALTTPDDKIMDLDARFRALPLPIFGAVDSNHLLLDLRTVLPRQDRALVEAIVGGPNLDTAQV
jgi:L-seryl-tRNA(Ser) seleniumtransferase